MIKTKNSHQSSSITIFTTPNNHNNNNFPSKLSNPIKNFFKNNRNSEKNDVNLINKSSDKYFKNDKLLSTKKMAPAPVSVKEYINKEIFLTHSNVSSSSNNSTDSLNDYALYAAGSQSKSNKLLNAKPPTEGSYNEYDYLEEDLDNMSSPYMKSENDDLATLSNLNEAVVLEQLKMRFTKNQIYTYIGDILISMNPLKSVPIYGKTVSNRYQKNDNVRANLPPHIYATAENCYREMMRTQQNQCILISGESGSGKTETCKYLVQHLLNRTKPFEVYLNSKIQEVNPLLEAFGNAKTRINDNSSRFGKYLEIYFEQDGSVVGAKFKEYLLEKSRVAFQNEYESTFHIFSHLFAGLTCAEKLHYGLLRSPEKYRYMPKSSHNLMTLENEEKFIAIKKSMVTIGFMSEDIDSLIKILISILLIGEIVFVKNKSSNNDAVQIKNPEIVNNVSDILELNPQDFGDSLISDVQITRGEEIKRDRNMVQACNVRDALAKALYGRLFSWIVNQINHHIQPVEGVTACYSIGLLDIFGFENFEKNSFEQMCINLANEQLHQIFTTYIFKLEIGECLAEDIDLTDSDLISYQDNQIILDLFLEKRIGIFALLDEESRFPQATDESLSIKLHKKVGNSFPDVYIPPKNDGASFHIIHYAGNVLYNADGFLEKNRDFLPNNLLYTARNSNNFLLQDLFQCKLTRKGTLAPSDRQSRLRKSMSSNSTIETESILTTTTDDGKSSVFSGYLNKVRFAASTISTSLSSMNSGHNCTLASHNSLKNKYDDNISHRVNSINSYNSAINQYTDKALPLTVACHFKNSLHELIEKINKCKAYFIRCIKPSPNQESVFINEFVVKQLRYCSIMHACKIRKCGYPYRVKFEEFLKWYKTIEVCILKNNSDNVQRRELKDELSPLQKCLKCLEYAKITNYKVGKTKLFLRYWHIDIFNLLAKKLDSRVLIAQKVVRGWLVRNRLKKMQKIESNKFLLQVSNLSQSIFAKLDYQKNFLLLPHQIKTKENELEAKNEILNNQKKFSIENQRGKEKSKKMNSQLCSKLQKNSDIKNWPDINEINNTLEQFDSMLHEYEKDDFKENYKTNKTEIKPLNLITANKNQSNDHKFSPNAVISLVNNNNNKCDNTLKKRNALVNFEFKTLLDKVSSPSENQIDEEKLNNEIVEIFPPVPYNYNDQINLNINHQTQSPPSLSSSSSSSSSNNSSSSASYSSQQMTDNFQAISPKDPWSSSFVINSPRIISPTNIVSYNNRFDNNRYDKYHLKNTTNIQTPVQALHSSNQNLRGDYRIDYDRGMPITEPCQRPYNKHGISNSVNANLNYVSSNNKNVTVWREELNTKNNIQQQRKKNTEFSQKIEESKKFVPEWKKNLIKQKEMKKMSSKNNINLEPKTNMNQVPETPELMKHNMFIKKGLATHL